MSPLKLPMVFLGNLPVSWSCAFFFPLECKPLFNFFFFLDKQLYLKIKSYSRKYRKYKINLFTPVKAQVTLGCGWAWHGQVFPVSSDFALTVTRVGSCCSSKWLLCCFCVYFNRLVAHTLVSAHLQILGKWGETSHPRCWSSFFISPSRLCS